MILETIKTTCGFVREHEDKFIAKVRSASEVQRVDVAKALKKRLSREQKRILELNQLIKKIYEDNVKGKLSDKRFEMLIGEYEKEQADLEESVVDLQKELDTYMEDTTRVDKFIELVHNYTDFTKLTTQ